MVELDDIIITHRPARYNQEVQYDAPPLEPALAAEVAEWVEEQTKRYPK